MLRHLKRQRAAQAAGFVAATIAAVALTGWWAGTAGVGVREGSEYSLIAPLAALCFAALGLALIRPGTNSRFAFVIGLVVAALTAADLGQDLSGTELGIERRLVPRSAVSRPEAGSFRMATTLALPSRAARSHSVASSAIAFPRPCSAAPLVPLRCSPCSAA
jgi:hypothetical protein